MLIALVLACGSEKDTSDVSNEVEEYEGDAAGECSDGADNDRDGKFDRDDEGEARIATSLLRSEYRAFFCMFEPALR